MVCYEKVLHNYFTPCHGKYNTITAVHDGKVPDGRPKPNSVYCQISCREGLGLSLFFMALTTQDPYILEEHIKLYKILKFRVNWANIEQDTAIQKLKNLLTNVYIAEHLSGNPYIS